MTQNIKKRLNFSFKAALRGLFLSSLPRTRLCQYFFRFITLPTDSTSFEFIAELKKAGIRAGVNAGVNAAVAGKGFGLAARDALLTGVVSLGAAYLASEIGGMRKDGDVDSFTHKIMHAALGGLSAAALGNDIGAGAIGAAVGETIAEAYAYYCLENHDAASGILDQEDLTKKGMILGRLGAAVGAYMAGFDPEEADRAASVALENNFIHFVPVAVAFVAAEALQVAGISLVAVGVVEGIIEIKEGYDRKGVKGAFRVIQDYTALEISTYGLGGAARGAARLCGAVQDGLAKLSHIPLAQREKVMQTFSNFFKAHGIQVPSLSVAGHTPSPQGMKGGSGGGGHVPKDTPHLPNDAPKGPQKEYDIQDRRDRVREKFGEKKAQVHHIISPTNEATMNHPLWDLSGMGKNAGHNLVILPTPKGVHLGGKRAIHAGRHNKGVMLDLQGQMDIAERIGQANGWNQKQYFEAMKRIMQAERKALVQGERALGKKHVQPGANPKFELKVDFGGI